MLVFYRGFNLYGQFPKPERVIENFIDYSFEDLTNCNFNHSFSIIQCGDKILYYGANKDQYNHFQKLGVEKIKQIACKNNKILFLSGDGDVYEIAVNNLNTVKIVPKFYGADEKINKLAIGLKICVAYTKERSLYAIPEKLDAFTDKDIIDIQAGHEHCILLDNDGNVYTFGRGSRGQLGHGTLDDEEVPKLVEALAGIKITCIAAGGWHSSALSQDGDLYTWGWNGCGQLGLNSGDKEKAVAVMATPQVCDFGNLDMNVYKVACGSRHTIALLDGNKLYGCGWNKYKQLLNNQMEDISNMTYLHDFSKQDVTALKCGPWSSVVICTK